MAKHPKLLYRTFTAVRELGRGGQARVLQVKAERESPGFKEFLAEALAWHEVNNHPQIAPLRLRIAGLNTRIDQTIENESEFMDQGLENDAADERKQLDILQEALEQQVNDLKAKQQFYIDKRSNMLTDASPESMIKGLENLGLHYPEDDMFAMKQILTDDMNARLRMQDEFKSLKLVQHDNILTVYAYGADYYIMEFIKGIVKLEEVVAHKEKTGGHYYTNEERINIIIESSRAIEHAHTFGVIHRDIKPDNIAINEVSNVKLIDFGLVKSLESTGLTQTGVAMGTPNFMCQEQVRSAAKATATFDIYSLGATLYNYLTGEKPYARAMHRFNRKIKRPESHQDIFLTICDRNYAPIPPSDIAAGIPEALEKVILKAMAKDADMRYQSVREFREDLEKYLELADGETLQSGSFFDIRSSQVRMRVRRRGRMSTTQDTRARSHTGEKGDSPLVKYAIAGAIGVVVILLIILFSILASDDGSGPTKREFSVQELYEKAEIHRANQPEDWDAHFKNFGKAAKKGGNSKYGQMAQARMKEIKEDWDRELKRVIKGLDAEADLLVELGRYADAAAVYEGYQGPFKQDVADLRWESVSEYKKQARQNPGPKTTPRPTPVPRPEPRISAAPSGWQGLFTKDRIVQRHRNRAGYTINGDVVSLKTLGYPIGIRLPEGTVELEFEVRAENISQASLYLRGVQFQGGDRSVSIGWKDTGELTFMDHSKNEWRSFREGKDKRQPHRCGWQKFRFILAGDGIKGDWQGKRFYDCGIPAGLPPLFGFQALAPGGVNGVFEIRKGRYRVVEGPLARLSRSNASGGPWTDLITGYDKQSSGWFCMNTDILAKLDNFDVANGIIRKTVGQRGNIYKNTSLKACELEFDYEQKGSYWSLQFCGGRSATTFSFTRNHAGAHRVRVVCGDTIKVELDGKSAMTGMRAIPLQFSYSEGGWNIVPSFRPHTKGIRIRFMAREDTSLKISNMRIRPIN